MKKIILFFFYSFVIGQDTKPSEFWKQYEQNEKIEHSKKDATLLLNNKKILALRWLYVSLKQLLYRDRHLFHTLPEKAA